mmetsp:Transcript_21200/g.49724  ORF Transcript_21200/g.49724 Transcript_21200/m.49724 type:complete len:209 (+) Transcript_21200:396-1022(+)
MFNLHDLPQDHHIFRVNACYGIQWNEDLHATGLIAKEEASEATTFPVTLQPRAATAAAVSQWPANQHAANQDRPRALEAVAAVPSICCLLMCDEALVAEVDAATQGLLQLVPRALVAGHYLSGGLRILGKLDGRATKEELLIEPDVQLVCAEIQAAGRSQWQILLARPVSSGEKLSFSGCVGRPGIGVLHAEHLLASWGSVPRSVTEH